MNNDIETYKAKINAFAVCFAMLTFKGELFMEGQFEAVRGKLVRSMREIMSDESFVTPTRNIPVPIEMLMSLNAVNLAADLETITSQAEAVKQEIIALGKCCAFLARAIKVPRLVTGTLLTPESKDRVVDDIPMTEKFTDYIRDPAGKVVYPFDFWEDCIEVYWLKHFYKLSNGRIAKKYHFKTSATAPGRQREKVVTVFLAEAERLKETVLQNKFPPVTLSAGKQPIMII